MCEHRVCLAALQATDAGEAFVHKVVDTLLPKPKPAKEAKNRQFEPQDTGSPCACSPFPG